MTMTPRLFFSVIFLFFGLYAILVNIVCCWGAYQGNWHGTLVPFLGGVLGCLGILTSPWESLHPYCWLPLILDPGCGLMVVAIIWEKHKRRSLGNQERNKGNKGTGP